MEPTSRSSVADDERAALEKRLAAARKRTNANLARSLQALADTEDVAAATLTTLAHQGDQIRNVHRNVKQTEAMNRRASYLITGMSSIWGSIRNAFVKPPGLGSADVRSAGGSGGSGGGSTGATAGGSSSRGSAAAGTHGGSSSSGSGSGGAGGSSVWPPAHDFTQEPEPSSSGSASGAGGGAGAVGVTHDQYQREEDAAMQAISKSLGRLKHAGVTVGETLDEHNTMLDDVSHDVDTARLHMRKNERRAKRLL